MKAIISGSRLAASSLALLFFAAVPGEAGLFKAKPAPESPFIEHPRQLAPHPRRVPFNRYWRNPSAQAWARVNGFNRIAIAPVDVQHLRSRSDLFAPRAGRQERRPVDGIAQYMRTRFEQQFARGGVYHVVPNSGPKTLVLELALVELNPSNVAGNTLRTGAQALLPGVGFLGSTLTRGRIAIEGKLRNAQTGELLMQFTDATQDKTSLLSLRDFSPYAHDREAINDWAKQVEQLSRTPRTQRIHGSSRVTLNPF